MDLLSKNSGTASQIHQQQKTTHQQKTTIVYPQTTQHLADQSLTTNTQALQYVSLPYVQGLSEKLAAILNPFNITIISRNSNDLSRIFKTTKDSIPKLNTANVVYNIPCTDCTACYIGTTKRPLKNRILEHKKDVYNQFFTIHF